MLAIFATEDDGSDRDDTENNQEIIYTSSGHNMALVPIGQQYSTPMEAEPLLALPRPTRLLAMQKRYGRLEGPYKEALEEKLRKKEAKRIEKRKKEEGDEACEAAMEAYKTEVEESDGELKFKKDEMDAAGVKARKDCVGAVGDEAEAPLAFSGTRGRPAPRSTTSSRSASRRPRASPTRPTSSWTSSPARHA